MMNDSDMLIGQFNVGLSRTITRKILCVYNVDGVEEDPGKQEEQIKDKGEEEKKQNKNKTN